MAAIILFFTSSVMLIIALAYIFGYSSDYDYSGETTRRIIRWEYVFGGIFDLLAFSLGIAGGIFAVRRTRFIIPLVASILLLVGGVIEFLADAVLEGAHFMMILAAIALVLIMASRDGYHDPGTENGTAVAIDGTEAYGWSRQAV
jgi:hypothetical protein